MRIKSRRWRRLSAELFETRCLLTAVPAELAAVDSADIFAEREGWQHIDVNSIPGIDGLLDSAGLRATDMAFLQNDAGHLLVRGHTSETILDVVVTAVESEVGPKLRPNSADSNVPNSALSPLAALPDYSSITGLPGFPEDATLSITPLNAGNHSLGTLVTVDTSAAGEPPSLWTPDYAIPTWQTGDFWSYQTEIQSSVQATTEPVSFQVNQQTDQWATGDANQVSFIDIGEIESTELDVAVSDSSQNGALANGYSQLNQNWIANNGGVPTNFQYTPVGASFANDQIISRNQTPLSNSNFGNVFSLSLIHI